MNNFTEQIDRWEALLDEGRYVPCGPTELDKALVVTLARRKHNQGPLPSDPLGYQATKLIEDSG